MIENKTFVIVNTQICDRAVQKYTFKMDTNTAMLYYFRLYKRI